MKDNSIEFDLPDNYSFPDLPNEQFLYYIWQFQYFNKEQLELDNGDKFEVIHPGRLNASQPNCFLEAKIKIENNLWVGDIELYLKTSELIKHRFQPNHINDNILLYVVWQNDEPDPIIKKAVFSLQPKALTIHQPILEKRKKQLNVPKESEELVSSDEKNMLKRELKVIKSLHELISDQKKCPILNNIRSLKVTTWQRETVRFYVEYGGFAKHVPKLLLLGNWLAKAGFECEKMVSVIPFKDMLIIIPQK